MPILSASGHAHYSEKIHHISVSGKVLKQQATKGENDASVCPDITLSSSVHSLLFTNV